jgi:hypothetical protein
MDGGTRRSPRARRVAILASGVLALAALVGGGWDVAHGVFFPRQATGHAAVSSRTTAACGAGTAASCGDFSN